MVSRDETIVNVWIVGPSPRGPVVCARARVSAAECLDRAADLASVARRGLRVTVQVCSAAFDLYESEWHGRTTGRATAATVARQYADDEAAPPGRF